ncbi:MAG: lipid A biosynthesis acyltransferase [Deltaproteobacteria bacterium]|nr:lipid A biosynthesis acyltransferase [Deltaproteobacteria bacterium]
MTGPPVVQRPRRAAARRKPLRKRIKHGIAYVLLRAVWGTLSLLPAGLLERLARVLGTLLALTPLRAAAVRNITLAYGAAPPSERFPTADALARACLTHYALTLMEAVCLDRWQPHLLQAHASIPAGMPELGQQIMQRGRGIVVATGHIGNWEMMGRGIAAAGYDVWSLAKAPFDGRVARWLEDWRLRGGVKIANRGSQATLRAVKEHLGRGGGLGALVDVDTPVKSAFVPFFGTPARTPTAAADLALRFDATLVVMWSWRERFGVHSGALVELPLGRTGDDDADAVRLTQQVTAVLEQAIRAHPEQWIWTHRRWKTRPPA